MKLEAQDSTDTDSRGTNDKEGATDGEEQSIVSNRQSNNEALFPGRS